MNGLLYVVLRRLFWEEECCCRSDTLAYTRGSRDLRPPSLKGRKLYINRIESIFIHWGNEKDRGVVGYKYLIARYDCNILFIYLFPR